MTTTKKYPKSKSYAQRICYNCYFSESFWPNYICCRMYPDRKINKDSKCCEYYLKDRTKKDMYIAPTKKSRTCLNCYFESTFQSQKSSSKVRVCRIYNKTLKRPYSFCDKWVRKDILNYELENVMGECSMCHKTIYSFEMTYAHKAEFKISQLCADCQDKEFGK